MIHQISFLPAVLSLSDWAWPRKQDCTPIGTPSPSPPQGLWSHLSTIAEKQRETRQRLPTRHIALAVSWAVLADHLVALTTQTDTGMVCPTGTMWPAAGLAQLLVRGIDASALFLASRRIREKLQPDQEPMPEVDGGRLTLNCIIAALAMMFLLAVTSPFSTSSLREITTTPAFRRLVVEDLFLDSILAAGVLLSGLYLLAYLTPTTLALVGSVVLTATHYQPMTGHGAARPMSSEALVLGILAVVCLSLLSQHTICLDTERLPATEKSQHKKRLTVCLAIVNLLFVANYTRSIFSNPQDTLTIVQNGRQISDNWISHAGASQSAREAAVAYRERYNLPPPPGFDRWHAFALAHKSPIIDIFDQIDSDLRPFWGLTPAALRARTSHLLVQKDLGIGGLRIRGGAVEFGKNCPPTHFWMLKAWKDMIEPFAAKLPDMDLAFNLDDECRVAIPADGLAGLQSAVDMSLHALSTSEPTALRGWFSKAADPPWDEKAFVEPAGDGPRSGYFSERKPRLGMFDEYVAPTCPANSAALRHRWFDANCAMPIARGGVIASTPDLCDRPDLAHLSGFLVSPGGPGPGGLAITQHPMPIFSQARVGGFNDILVPSPWHFADKVVVDEAADVEWKDKSDTVFWRGSSTDGWAQVHKWPVFLRARLANLGKRVRLGSSSSQTRTDAPAVDIAFTGKFTRCGMLACHSMKSTFYGHSNAADAPATDFQDHWLYRHLIDVDGTGFSGRFLSFLRSKSTPYRATLFRTWLDERIHPWKHFVPLDVSLSGLWDVIWLVNREFFVKDPETPMAQEIAMEGRDWAAKALRKEDMQIYMYRMLLEWGRLIDDRREELGYNP